MLREKIVHPRWIRRGRRLESPRVGRFLRHCDALDKRPQRGVENRDAVQVVAARDRRGRRGRLRDRPVLRCRDRPDATRHGGTRRAARAGAAGPCRRSVCAADERRVRPPGLPAHRRPDLSGAAPPRRWTRPDAQQRAGGDLPREGREGRCGNTPARRGGPRAHEPDGRVGGGVQPGGPGGRAQAGELGVQSRDDGHGSANWPASRGTTSGR